jgi:hypothetical protein
VLDIDAHRREHRRRRELARGDAEPVVRGLEPAVGCERDPDRGLAAQGLREQLGDRAGYAAVDVLVPRGADADPAFDLAIDGAEHGRSRRDATGDRDGEDRPQVLHQ